MMGDMGDYYNDLKADRKERRAKLGIECEDCKRLLPKANPSILLPGQKCKMHKFRAPAVSHQQEKP
jgi:hypothetical protein